MDIPDAVPLAFDNRDWPIFQEELRNYRYDGQATICVAITKRALASDNLMTLRLCLENTSSGYSSVIYTYIQDSSDYTSTIRRLLEAGLPPDFCPGWAETPLLTDAIENNHPELLQLLLDAGAFDSLDWLQEETDFYPWLENISMSVSQILIRFEAKRLGAIPLHIAATEGNVEAIRALLAEGLNINEMPDVRGFVFQELNSEMAAPLHFAAQCRHMDAVVLLLDRGANAKMRDRKGRSVLDRSVVKGFVWEELERLLVE